MIYYLNDWMQSRIIVFFFQNANIVYIMESSRAEITLQAQWSGIRDGITITIRHMTVDGIISAEYLLYKLLEGV